MRRRERKKIPQPAPGVDAGATISASAVINLSDIPDGDNIDKQLVTGAIGNTITENLGVRSLTIEEKRHRFRRQCNIPERIRDSDHRVNPKKPNRLSKDLRSGFFFCSVYCR